jgi:uncharacterized protein YndB with AHSA1/START domain
MEAAKPIQITVDVLINASLQDVWNKFNYPEHITKWCFATDDWCCPWVKSDFVEGGKHTTRMEAKDGSLGFDLVWVFTTIKKYELVEYTLSDNRKVSVRFEPNEAGIRIIETFEAENEIPADLQQAGWKSILNSFKTYVEGK